jgi:hypothetical protein
MKMFVIAGALVAFAGAAVAAEEAFPRRFKPNQYDQVVELIEANMQPGGDWEATSDEQTRVRALLGEIGGLLEGNERIADLDQNEKDAIEKRRAEINAILTPPERQVAADQKATSGRKHRKAHELLDARPASQSDF